MKTVAIWLASIAIVAGVGLFRDDNSDQLVADSVLDAQRAARHVQAEVKARTRQAARLAQADHRDRLEQAARMAASTLVASTRLVP
jgi:hypothetical protein